MALRPVPNLDGGSRNIRAAMLADEPRVAELIVSAFETDPAARWMYPDIWDYRVHFAEFMRVFGGRAFASGTAHVLQDFAGAALWLPPGVSPDDEGVMAFIVDTTPKELQASLMAVFEEMSSYHPTEAHWHLPLIGVHPFLRTCDEQGLPAYLESSNPENIPLYERHGFEVLGKIRVGSS